MRSWDLFRTLVQARNGRAGEDSIENHFPIAENVCQVAPDDIIVSEYEKEREGKAAAIVARTGLRNKLIVTPWGKSDSSIWPTLKAEGYEITNHTGDHFRCDIEGPQKHGILAVQVFQHQSTEFEQEVDGLGFPALSRTIKEARLVSWHEKFRDLQLFQVAADFPFLFMVASALARYAKGYKRLLLSSRDCWLLCRLMERFYGETFEIEYFFTSRIARYQPSDSYREYARSRMNPETLIIDLCGTGNSLKHFFGDAPTVVVVGLENCCVPHLIPGWIDESSNFARHAMIVDIQDGKPITANPLNIDWETWPELIAMEQAFDVALECSKYYDWSQDLTAAPRLDIGLRAINRGTDILNLHFGDIRKREALTTWESIRQFPGAIA